MGVIDDMPVLGYGWGALSHSRLSYFHTLLAGHSANYLSRGTFWGTEQREQSRIVDERYSNFAGPEGEYGSLCMVSAIPVSMWTRWMLVREERDSSVIHLASVVPRRWFAQPESFGITHAPTRLGIVSYSLQNVGDRKLEGWAILQPSPNSQGSRQSEVLCSIRLLPAEQAELLSNVSVAGDAGLIAIFPENSTAVFRLASIGASFNFTALFVPNVSREA